MPEHEADVVATSPSLAGVPFVEVHIASLPAVSFVEVATFPVPPPPVAEIVTSPVAPDTEIPEPAITEVTPVLEIVKGVEPSITGVPEREIPEPDVESVVVAVLLVNPLEPLYRRPCDKAGKNRLPENVEEAVEKSPFSKPITVDVAL